MNQGPIVIYQYQNWSFVQPKIIKMAGGSGCTIAHPLFQKCELRQAFSRKKNFENRLKFDRVRGKNVNCASIFQQLPPALYVLCKKISQSLINL